LSSLNHTKEKTNYKNYFIKSPKLNGAIVENILLLLCTKEFSIHDLSFEIQKRLPSSSFNFLHMYLVYLVDYELISYSGQRHVYLIEDNGLELLERIDREKKNSLVGSEDITITLEKDIINR
jgi:hypothetical protein